MIERRQGDSPKDYSRYPFTSQEWARMRFGTTAEDKLLGAIFGGRYIPESKTEGELEALRLEEIELIREFVAETLSIAIEEVPTNNYEALDRLKNQATMLIFQREADKVLVGLTPLEKKVLELRFGLPPAEHSYTQAEVGREFGKSRSTVGRIERRARKKLQEQRRHSMPES